MIIETANNDDINKEEDEDFISKLPDTILIQIISLLPDADANRTRILSNRWKDLCSFLPNLKFVMYNYWSVKEIHKFQDSVEQTLALRDGMPIQRLALSCCWDRRVSDLVRTAVNCNVQKLVFSFLPQRYWNGSCSDRELLKMCNSLVELTLTGEYELDVPEAELLFPCLRKLDLVSVKYSGDQSVTNLIAGCPVLEELFVERKLLFDKLQMFQISSPSLKILRLSFAKTSLGEFFWFRSVIDAPKLEYIHIEDKMSECYSFTQMPFLVEAHISITGSARDFLSRLSSAKTLTLTYSTLEVIESDLFRGTVMFPNLVKLVIGVGTFYLWTFLVWGLMINMPNLEHITFLDGFPPKTVRCDDLLEEAPDCLRFKMKKIIILNWETERQEEFIYIKFMLEQSTNLETFTINAHKLAPEMREQILNFHRGSSLCQVEFI